MRVVLDTNVLVSAALIARGQEARILRAWRAGTFDLVVSPAILEEIGRVLTEARIRRRRWMTDDEVAALLEGLAQESVLVPGRAHIEVSRDPTDDKLLAAAIEGRADYIVTGDRDLLDLATYRGVRMIRPGSFARQLARERREPPR
jgi:putative PIN family toxin of toxin-antitoxin system